MKKRNGFTLVELLAVIVILAIILVIAVPAITKTIEDATKGSFESSAKLIASNAETYYLTQQALGKTITSVDCASVASFDQAAECKVVLSSTGAAKVSIKGSDKFAGLYICGATKSSATAKNTKDTGCNPALSS